MIRLFMVEDEITNAKINSLIARNFCGTADEN